MNKTALSEQGTASEQPHETPKRETYDDRRVGALEMKAKNGGS